MKKIITILVICFIFIGCSEYEEGYNLKLINLSEREGITGTFFLGCGSIGTELYYIGYVYVEDHIERVIINNSARIFYIKEKEVPHVTVYFYNSVMIYVNKNGKYGHRRLLLHDFTECNNTTFFINIYIPEGSIKENYNLGGAE